MRSRGADPISLPPEKSPGRMLAADGAYLPKTRFPLSSGTVPEYGLYCHNPWSAADPVKVCLKQT